MNLKIMMADERKTIDLMSSEDIESKNERRMIMIMMTKKVIEGWDNIGVSVVEKSMVFKEAAEDYKVRIRYIKIKYNVTTVYSNKLDKRSLI